MCTNTNKLTVEEHQSVQYLQKLIIHFIYLL